MPTANPTRMSAAQRRAQLLDVTKELVAEHGFHAVSIEAVARRAGITRPIVYGHFGDLAGLLEALVEREAARALTQLAAILPTGAGGDPGDQLFAAMEGYLRAAQADPATWTLVLMPPEGAPPVLRDHIGRGREAIVAALADAVGPGVGTPDPELFARMLSALSDEAVRLLLTDAERYSTERLLAHTRWLLDRMTAA